MSTAPQSRLTMVVLVLVALIASVTSLQAGEASAVAAPVVFNEVVAANTVEVDSFGDTSDWIELANESGDPVDLTGWTLSDSDNNSWAFPPMVLDTDELLVVWASGRDVPGAEPHASFSLKSTGESLLLADAAGAIVDALTYPALPDDQAWGRGPNGVSGFLASPTRGAVNGALLPSQVTIETPGQTFQSSLMISLSATVNANEAIRYTTDGSPVSESSPQYTGPFEIIRSTVVRAAVVGDGLIGHEVTAGYTGIAPSIADFDSDLPIVLVHSTGVVGEEEQDAIVTIIEPDADGRAGVFDTPSYDGFAGLRVRGQSSSSFSKKQYKFETWSDPSGTEVDVDLFGMGADSDWGLYAPGRFDRAMINNPFMYELGHQLGVVAPDWRFVEVFIEDNMTATVGAGDYLGLFVLRESIEIGPDRVDIAEQTQTTSGEEAGYIVRYDWNDDCCLNILPHPHFGSRIAIDTPNADNITAPQIEFISSWWQGLQDAAGQDFVAADDYLDFDSIIDGWLLEMLAFDVDSLRASHYMHRDGHGQLRAGPLWDYDRSLGGADWRIDELTEAESWDPSGGHSWESDFYADLWELSEVQTLLRARWAELRAAELSDAALAQLINDLGAQIDEAYTREAQVWFGPDYGSRFGGLAGELDHMTEWVHHRAAWIDEQFFTFGSPPDIVDPGPQIVAENEPLTVALEADGAASLLFTATGLPEGLTLDPWTGVISGVVGYGDGGLYEVSVDIIDSEGGVASVVFPIEVMSPATNPPAVLLNEFNAVAPGLALADGGSDSTLGTVAGNGGDWFELVTLDDNIDMRGWSFDVWHASATGSLIQTAHLVLGDAPLLNGLRAGSIITVAESVADDPSYDPLNGDWTINLQANNAQSGAFFQNQTNFDTNHNKWRLVVRDSLGDVRALIAGETAPWDAANLGVAADEVMALVGDPAADVDPVTDWLDLTDSTFGRPNLHDGSLQDFSALRPLVVPLGDVNCSAGQDIADALMIAQFTVGLRTPATECPLPSPTSSLRLDNADLNGDGTVSIVDALIISQCEVGLSTVFCPVLS